MTTAATRTLNVPTAVHKQFKRNFIRQAVVELRFPTLYDLSGDTPPLALAKALRKDYPYNESGHDVNLAVSGVAQAPVHTFKSKRWSVTLRPSSLTLETTNYISFDDMSLRLAQLVDAARSTIDCDAFTRVGMRYINSVPFGKETPGEWVNPQLVHFLVAGIYGDALEHWQRVSGKTDIGGFVFQHGLQVVQGTGAPRGYVLDFDFSAEDVPVDDCLTTAARLHDLEYSMFIWSLGEDAKRALDLSLPE